MIPRSQENTSQRRGRMMRAARFSIPSTMPLLASMAGARFWRTFGVVAHTRSARGSWSMPLCTISVSMKPK